MLAYNAYRRQPHPDSQAALFREDIVALTAVAMPAYDEVVDLIARGTSPDRVIAFRPSEAAKARVADLISREKDGGLSLDETAELNHYMELEHLMRLAKARARDYAGEVGAE